MNISGIMLFRERPASRMIAVEALGTFPFAVMALPYGSPENRAVPEWAQFFGLVMIVMLYATALHTWRLVMVGGLRPAATPRQQLSDDRRLRMLVLGYPLLVALLLPVPSTWITFWFWLTLLSVVSGTVSLVRIVVILSNRSIPATAARTL
jgi:hypothetical protein